MSIAYQIRYIATIAFLTAAIVIDQISLMAEPPASAPAQDVSPKPATFKYPPAIDPQKVGRYPAVTKSGGGCFYDEVLEYRVWFTPVPGGGDSYKAFATYEEAKLFSQKTRGAEKPLVLIRQLEHVNEPKKGVFERVVGERITEWVPAWLEGSKREPDSIAKFLANPRPARTNSDK